MHMFVVVIWFLFAGQNGKVGFNVSAHDAEEATRIGLRLSHSLMCTHDGKAIECVQPGSYALSVTQS
jgi:hypothetical protein